MRFLFFIIRFSFFSHGFMELDKSTLTVFDLWDNSLVSNAMTTVEYFKMPNSPAVASW